MALQRPTFNSVNSNDPKINNQNKIDNIKGSDTKISAPKVATSYKKRIMIIAIVALIVVVIITASIFIIGNTGVKDIKDISIKLDIPQIKFEFAGNDSDIIVDEDGTHHIAIMPGQVFNGKVALTSTIDENYPELAGDVFVRFRLEAYVDDNYYGDILKASTINDLEYNWYNDGRYFYYNDLLSPNETITSELQLVLDNNNISISLQSKSVKFIVTFQVLQASQYQSINEMWVGAPNAWKTSIIKKANQSS